MEKQKDIKVWVGFVLTMITSGLLHGINMFNFPYFESDEGTYISQAWSIVTQGVLTPYTYWYDHPPLGWYAIAGWASLFEKDFFAFGMAIDTGRVFMLVLQLISTALIFFIVRRVTGRTLPAMLAGFLFAVSPLAIYFHRRVLLDNIMIMWVLASIAILYVRNIKLRHYVLSGAFYAIAFLTKVTAAMFGPAILGLVILHMSGVTRSFRVTGWLAVSVAIASVYVMFALIRGEFFPQGFFDDTEHVSLVSTLLFQAGRGGSGVIEVLSQNNLAAAISDWTNKDVFSVYFGGVVLAIATAFSLWRPKMRFFVAAALLYMFFLMRGGLVINFYVIPLIPLVAILAALLWLELSLFISQAFAKSRQVYIGTMLLGVILLSAYFTFFAKTDHFTRDETAQQRSAVTWIKQNLHEDAPIVIDNYALVELWDPRFENEKVFQNADWFYKVSQDPAIRDEKYNDNWRSFEYVALTHEMLKQIESGNHPLIRDTYVNSLPVAKWTASSVSFIDEQKFISTNGDWAMVFQVNGTTRQQLLDAWNHYKARYIKSYGQIIDPTNNDVTTSEGQSYAMLMAAWMNDREAFKGTWLWTRDHFQFRLDDKLFSWKWQDDELVDSTNASDADLDIAGALLFAYKLWGDQEHLDAAKEIIDSIWEKNVVEINGRYYLLAMSSDSADRPHGYLMNPSYFSPHWYRIFADVDPDHDWNKLVTDTYTTLNEISNMPGNTTGLPPDWLLVDQNTGALKDARAYIGPNANHFGFDAFRTLWRVSLDYEWFGEPEALKYIDRINQYLAPQYQRAGDLPTVLGLDGTAQSWTRSIANDAGYLAALMHHHDKSVSIDFFGEFIEETFDEEGKYWGDGWNYYDSNWAWFGTGLFNGALNNLWLFERE